MSFRSLRPASSTERGALYLASAAYGLHLGLWLDAELRLDDPSLYLIPPTVLGVAAPVTAYVANQPSMGRGKPGAIAAGIALGAGEGLAVAGLQMATSSEPWGSRQISRAVAAGSTLGLVGGVALAELQQPSPRISLFAASAALWGAAVGGMMGVSTARTDELDDSLALGSLVGLNAGVLVSMGLSTLFVPGEEQLAWMWIGAGVGAVLSLPAYLLYIPRDAPPYRRGLLFSATATTLGVIVGGIFGPEVGGDLGRGWPDWVSVAGISPVVPGGGLGLSVTGSLR